MAKSRRGLLTERSVNIHCISGQEKLLESFFSSDEDNDYCKDARGHPTQTHPWEQAVATDPRNYSQQPNYYPTQYFPGFVPNQSLPLFSKDSTQINTLLKSQEESQENIPFQSVLTL